MSANYKMPCDEIWQEIIPCGGYASEVDDAIIAVMQLIRDKMPIFYTDICKITGFQSEFVQLIQYILSTLDYAEYGTSPKGCWLTAKGEKMLKLFESRQESIPNNPAGKE